MAYEITVTEEQARVIRDACEMYARVGMGQIGFISEHPALHQLQALMRDGVAVADGIAQHYRDKIEHPHADTTRAWDLYQVVRGRLAWDAAGNPPARPTMQVMYDVPLNTTGEPLAAIRQEIPADILPDESRAFVIMSNDFPLSVALTQAGAEREVIRRRTELAELLGNNERYRVRYIRACEVALASPRPEYSIQILSSEDGIDWVHAVLYPASWSKKEATERAVEALTEAQKADPENWDWDDLVPELKAHGFTITAWHRGPNWDTQRVPIPEEE
jgi:hypothetical protein